jgi:hypothetical protein
VRRPSARGNYRDDRRDPHTADANDETPLTCDRVAAILRAEGHPADSYGIGRQGKYLDQAHVLERWSNRWVVYYIERGSKSNLRKHTSEDAACRDLLSRLRH